MALLGTEYRQKRLLKFHFNQRIYLIKNTSENVLLDWIYVYVKSEKQLRNSNQFIILVASRLSALGISVDS